MCSIVYTLYPESNLISSLGELAISHKLLVRPQIPYTVYISTGAACLHN